jgi:hypothetical protein
MLNINIKKIPIKGILKLNKQGIEPEKYQTSLCFQKTR